jgi:flagellar protein FliO/FliZ
LMRRAAPQGFTRLPSEAFEVLGRAPLFGRQNVHLIRCGNKLLLVSVTPAGTETLTEIVDPQEVDRLAGLCRQAGPQSSTAAFKQIFEQLAPKRPVRGAFSKDDFADYDSSGGALSDQLDWEQRHV